MRSSNSASVTRVSNRCAKPGRMRAGYTKRQHFDLGATTATVMDAVNATSQQAVSARIWRRDPDLWKPGDAAHAEIIANRLGWLDVIDSMQERLPELLRLSSEVV